MQINHAILILSPFNFINRFFIIHMIRVPLITLYCLTDPYVGIQQSQFFDFERYISHSVKYGNSPNSLLFKLCLSSKSSQQKLGETRYFTQCHGGISVDSYLRVLHALLQVPFMFEFVI